MNATYDVEEWANGTTRGRQVFNFNYRMLGSELKGWKLVKVVTMQEGGEATARVYLWQSKSDPAREMVRISITERHHWRLAQESLREHLMNCMRPDIPKGTKKLAQLGDVIFVSREPQTDIAAAMSFSTGNMCVTVSSVGESNVDVATIATTLERALSAPPAKGELEKGKVGVQAPRVATVKANEAYVLIKNLQEAVPRGGRLKIIVPDGELSRKGDALVYVSPQGGEKPLGIFAVSGD
jgi:hypothetical protein